MKKHILNAYELVPESYRAKFRSLTRINDETYVEFAQKKSKTFQRWLDSRNIDGDFDKLKNLVLVEEFKKQLPTEIRTHLNDLDIHDLKTCAVKADEFALSHKLFAHSNRTAQRQNHAGKWNGTPPHQSDANKSNNLSNVQCFSCKNFGHYKNTCPQLTKKANANSESVSPETDKKQNTCAKCKRRGHWTKDCWSDKLCTLCNNVGHIEEVCKSKPKSAGLVALASPPIENNNQNYVAEVTRRVHNVTVNPVNVKANEVFRPFFSKGSITYDGKNYPVDILRDTGCALSLILKSAIPSIVDDDGNTNGQYEIVKGVGDILTSVPSINLTLNSEFVNDDVVVGVAENIPVPGITFLLGNDLAKEKVTSENPRMIENITNCDNSDNLKVEFPGVFPSCVTTRAMERDRVVNEDRINSQLLNPIETNLVGNFPTDANRGGNIDPAFECSFPGDPNNTGNTDLKFDDNANELLQTSSDKLIQAQKLDKSISHLLQSAVTYKPTDNIPLGYYCLDNGVLMRKWRPSTEPSDQE